MSPHSRRKATITPPNGDLAMPLRWRYGIEALRFLKIFNAKLKSSQGLRWPCDAQKRPYGAESDIYFWELEVGHYHSCRCPDLSHRIVSSPAAMILTRHITWVVFFCEEGFEHTTSQCWPMKENPNKRLRFQTQIQNSTSKCMRVLFERLKTWNTWPTRG